MRKKIGVTDQTYCRWRNEYGGMREDQAKRLKKFVVDQALDISILREAAWGDS